MITLKQVRGPLAGYAHSISRNKDGNIVVRRSFFYTHGRTAQKFADECVALLAAAGCKVQVKDLNEIWKPFRGGHSVAQGSHFYAELTEVQ